MTIRKAQGQTLGFSDIIDAISDEKKRKHDIFICNIEFKRFDTVSQLCDCTFKYFKAI